ncbi:PAS domain S-box protein [Defluviimonas sp. SAOS-178_SWC]
MELRPGGAGPIARSRGPRGDGEPARYDAEIRVAGDRRLCIDFQLAPHRDPSGAIDYIVASGVDITKRKESEARLKASHDSFKHLVANAPFGIHAVDADFRLAMLSAGAQKTFGTVSPLIGRDFSEILRLLWPEPFASEAIGHFRRTLETGIPYHAPSTVERRHDIDALESYDWKIERVTLPDGRLGAVCYFYDLSEREHHAAKLRESEARFRARFENAAVDIAHVARDGSWLRVSTKLCDILGYTPDELARLSFQDITHPEDLDKDLSLLADVLAGTIDEYEMENATCARTEASFG